MKKSYIFIMLFVLLILFIGFVSFLYLYEIYSMDHELQEKMMEKAYKEVAALETIDDMDYFTGHKAYYFIFGKNKKEIPMLVWLNKDEVHSIYLLEWVNKEDIKQKALAENADIEIKRLTAGVDEKNRLMYEILFEDKDERLGYLYYDLKTGEFLKKYRLSKVS